MKVRTLVVDDEPVARAGLRALLTAFDWVEVVGEAADGVGAVEAINRLRPELVFLDVPEQWWARWVGRIPAGPVSDHPWAHWDILPTIAAVARAVKKSSSSPACVSAYEPDPRNAP